MKIPTPKELRDYLDGLAQPLDRAAVNAAIEHFGFTVAPPEPRINADNLQVGQVYDLPGRSDAVVLGLNFSGGVGGTHCLTWAGRDRKPGLVDVGSRQEIAEKLTRQRAILVGQFTGSTLTYL